MDGPPVATASRSSHGLDGVNFFVAAVQTGFGSSVTVYLVKNQWPPDAIGFALTIATLSTLFSQIPAGAALDSMREKRPAVLLGIAGVGLAALLLCVTTARPAVDLALAMQGLASSLTEDTDVSQIARLFSIHQIKRVPIVCDGRIACLVARADLLHVVAATQSQSTGEDKAKHRGFFSLFGEYQATGVAGRFRREPGHGAARACEAAESGQTGSRCTQTSSASRRYK